MNATKKTSWVLTPILAAVAAFCLCGGSGEKPAGERPAGRKAAGEKIVVTSFYPIYIAVKNITTGIGGIKVMNMISDTEAGGCLHDYHLTPASLALLERADALVINGGGMETFIERIAQKDNLFLIDASSDIEFIIERTEMNAHDHKHGHTHNRNAHLDDDLFVHHDGSNAQYVTNPHVWMSIENHIRQVGVIAWRLSQWDSVNTNAYNENAQNYILKLRELRERAARHLSTNLGNLVENIDDPRINKVILANDGLLYLMRESNLEVVAVIEQTHGTAPSAANLVNVINAIQRENPIAIFTERGAPSAAANTVAAETGLPIFELDMITSGEDDKNAYINAMERNLMVIANILICSFLKGIGNC